MTLHDYHYRGRHRAPAAPLPGARAAVVTALAVGLPLGLSGTASAASPDWDPIIACESGGDPKAQNRSSSASGLYQFIDGTWAAYGGRQFAPRAKDATPTEQRIVADRAHDAEGLAPWNASRSCWAGKTAGRAEAPVPKRAPKAKAAPKAKIVEQVAAPKTGRTARTSGLPAGYVVKRGDTLGKLAERYGVPGGYRAIAKANRIADPNLIIVGQVLR